FSFRVRELGLPTIFQPETRLVRLDPFGTRGDRDTGTTRRDDAVDRDRLARVWRNQLGSRLPPGSANLLLARDSRPGPRVLVVDEKVPTPDRDSGSLRMLSILRLMSEMGLVITLVPFDRAMRGSYSRQLEQMGIEVLYGQESVEDHIRAMGKALKLVLFS